MQIQVKVDPVRSTAHEFAKVALLDEEGSALSELDVQFDALRDGCGVLPALPIDFLLFASVVYAVDKVVRRDQAIDKWTRDICLTVPVSDPERWEVVREELQQLLSFLTGDLWQLAFEPLKARLYRPKRRQRLVQATRLRLASAKIRGESVCLFSGGLDSLIGAVDWLETNPLSTLCLAAHHDGEVAGPKSDQNAVFGLLKGKYGKRVVLLPIRVGERFPGRGEGMQGQDRETTFRSRSLLFLALGLCAASTLGENTPVLLPENGTIALNVPLTPSRRGSCSTRTAHPYFVAMLQSIWQKMGMKHTIENPYITLTKGECVERCRNQALLQTAIPHSVSCAKRGHKRTWVRRTGTKQCGRCMPCIYRRAALHKMQLDTEMYGNDVCTGEVDFTSDEEAADDLRACLSFLRRQVSQDEIAQLLIESGRLDIERLDEYAGTVSRAMEEIRQLLRDKATIEMKRRAGLEQKGK